MESIKRDVTVVLLIKDGQVWLAMKKRGFGVNRWNGFGGKMVPEDEGSVARTASRETGEESGVIVKEENLRKVAEIEFYFSQKPEWNQRGHVFIVEEWEGEPVETEEMRPQRFAIADIPYGEMWPEDKLWMPRILNGETLFGRILFKDLEGNAESYYFENREF